MQQTGNRNSTPAQPTPCGQASTSPAGRLPFIAAIPSIQLSNNHHISGIDNETTEVRIFMNYISVDSHEGIDVDH